MLSAAFDIPYLLDVKYLWTCICAQCSQCRSHQIYANWNKIWNIESEMGSPEWKMHIWSSKWKVRGQLPPKCEGFGSIVGHYRSNFTHIRTIPSTNLTRDYSLKQSRRRRIHKSWFLDNGKFMFRWNSHEWHSSKFIAIDSSDAAY